MKRKSLNIWLSSLKPNPLDTVSEAAEQSKENLFYRVKLFIKVFGQSDHSHWQGENGREELQSSRLQHELPAFDNASPSILSLRACTRIQSTTESVTQVLEGGRSKNTPCRYRYVSDLSGRVTLKRRKKSLLTSVGMFEAHCNCSSFRNAGHQPSASLAAAPPYNLLARKPGLLPTLQYRYRGFVSYDIKVPPSLEANELTPSSCRPRR